MVLRSRIPVWVVAALPAGAGLAVAVRVDAAEGNSEGTR